MPPKKAPAKESKKTEQKKKEKIIEDKTFGLKNKKGAKTQKYIQNVQKQVIHGNKSNREIELSQVVTKKNKAEEKKKELEELSKLLKPVVTQKIEKGVDPKSVVCSYFKAGICTRGDKCKFSHDLAVERRSEKRSVYYDERDAEKDGMEDWDEEKLREVVNKKHGGRLPQTDIICKYFLDAVENNKYGWFWECPNGGPKCHYKHALPTGFVLKKDKKKEEKKDEISIEELVEIERAKLGYDLPKINLESFLAWKKRKIEEKRKAAQELEEKRRRDFKQGKQIGMSGREMFTFNPDLVADQDMEEDEATFDYVRRDSDDEDEDEEGQAAEKARREKVKLQELSLDDLARMAREVDNSGTVLNERRTFAVPTRQSPDPSSSAAGATGGGSPEPGCNGGEQIDVDEQLFDQDEDDLEELEEELKELEVH